MSTFFLLKFFVKTEICQKRRVYKMLDMHANLNEGMVFKLVISMRQEDTRYT